MRLQVVLNQTNTFNMSVMLLKQLLHKCSIIDSRSPCSHFNITKTRMWLKRQEDTVRPILFIFIMVAFGFARTHGQDRAHISNEKARAFVKTDQRAPWIIRQCILIKDIFHMPKVITCNFTNTPLFTQPRFEFTFFKILLTLS